MNIKKYWVEFEELMRSTRYLWSPLPTEFDLEEWKGEKLPDGQRGFGIAGKFYDLLNRGMKAAYVAGHKEGSLAAIEALGKDEADFDESLDAACARDKWGRGEEEL